MYKGFFEDVEYVMGLFFRPFEGCCEKDDDEDGDEERECGMGCDNMPCCREKDDDGEENEGKGCDSAPCGKDEEDAGEENNEKEKKGGILGEGPIQDIMKCMFDASDIDYDYED